MIFVRAQLLCAFLFALELQSMDGRHNFGLNCALNFQCINQTHDEVGMECTFQSQPRLPASCSALNLFRIFVTATPVMLTGAYGVEKFYCKASFGAKKLVRMGACIMLYTAASLYAYENYVSNNGMTECLTYYYIAVGNVVIAELLKR